MKGLLLKRVVVSTIVSISLLLMFTHVASADEAEDFAEVKQQDSLESWQSFLDKYPKGQNVKAAKQAFDELLYKKAKATASEPQKLEAFFKRAKTSAYADKIFILWEEASWNKAKALDSTEGYRSYLLHFPGGKHVEEAKSGIEELSWRRCQQRGDREAYDQHLKEYPKGKHAKEAQEILDDLEYQEVQRRDTIAAYQEFLKSHYNHKAAGKRLRQLMYEKAVKTGNLEDWIAFYDKYRSRGWTDDGKDVEQMKENAKKEIERLLYQKIIASPTLELCEDYLDRYRDGPHKQQVTIKMEPCLFEHAIQKNDTETYLKYLEKYPEGYRDSEIKKRLNDLIFTKLGEKEDFRSFEKYLRLCPKNKASLLSRMEPLMFDWAKRVNTIESYEKYIKEYPEGPSFDQARRLLGPLLFKKAQDDDWYSSYEDYIKKCPNGANIQKAKKRIEWLKSSKAVVEVDYPRVLEQPGGRWSWTTKFKETGGKIGYKVTGSGYIYDSEGDKWGIGYGWSISVSSIGRGTVNVPAGGTAKDSYWCGNAGRHTWCNGYALFTWSGEDAGGHPIKITEKVLFKHDGCPGSKD